MTARRPGRAPAGFPPPQAEPGASRDTAVPVSAISAALKALVEQSFTPVWIRGEVTNFTAHRNGHWYFTLRDAEAQLRCVVWARDAARLPAPPEDGMLVVVQGRVGVYAARTEVQLSVAWLEADGDGLWEKALQATIETLTREGLIDPARRRPLPRLPKRVAVVTSADGAAWRDIVSVARRRHPGVELVLAPAAVQGETAPASLMAALERVIRWGAADLVIIGRGGGSREDLWAFNNIDLARAIARCPIPIISAVGHEVDTTVADLVADLRAATPSAAAEAAVPSLEALRHTLALTGRHLAGLAEGRVRGARERLRRLRQGLGYAIEARIARAREGLRTRDGALARTAQTMIDRRRQRLALLGAHLDALSPLKVLLRGFTVATDDDGHVVRSIKSLETGAPLHLRLVDGWADVAVSGTRPAALASLPDSSPQSSS